MFSQTTLSVTLVNNSGGDQIEQNRVLKSSLINMSKLGQWIIRNIQNSSGIFKIKAISGDDLCHSPNFISETGK